MTPYGYRIVQGKAEADPDTSIRLARLYALYLEGTPLMKAAALAGIPRSGPGVGALLSNRLYLGGDFYPRLIDDATFEQMQALRVKRARSHPLRLRRKGVSAGQSTYRFVPPPDGAAPPAGDSADLAAAVYRMIQASPPPEEGGEGSVRMDRESEAAVRALFQALHDQRSLFFTPTGAAGTAPPPKTRMRAAEGGMTYEFPEVR